MSERGEFEVEHAEWRKMDNMDRAVFRISATTWYYAVVEVEVPKPDHNCGPDCACWKRKKR